MLTQCSVMRENEKSHMKIWRMVWKADKTASTKSGTESDWNVRIVRRLRWLK